MTRAHLRLGRHELLLPLLLLAPLSRALAAEPLLEDSPAGAADQVPIVRQTRELMHTVVTVGFAEPPTKGQSSHAEDFERAFAVFEHVDATLNEWRPESPLSAVNASAGGAPVEASRELCAVVSLALEGARRTGGLFDPTWATLRGLWRFGTDASAEVPAPEQVKERCGRVAFRDVQLTPLPHPTPERACTIGLARKGMLLGLGGLVKGWGVDEAVRRLRARGYRHFFVQAGGDLYAAGKRGRRPWRVAIREPRAEGSFAQLDVSDRAFSTSGDYERFFLKEGVRYHHIIDLRDCYPARASVSSTVLARSAVDAEFLTKAAFILGGEPGLALVERWGAAAVLVSPDGRLHVSRQLRGKLQASAPRGFTTGSGATAGTAQGPASGAASSLPADQASSARATGLDGGRPAPRP